MDIFFVISGFVITAMLEREWREAGRIRFGRFYARRFKRLTPALAVMVVVTLAATAFILSPVGPQQNAAKTGIGAMLLAANVVIARSTGGYFDAPAELNPLLHTWSLSVEEQFYLAFPALLAVLWVVGTRIRRRRHVTVLAVGGVAAVSFGLAVAGSSGLGSLGLPDSLVGFYGPLTRVWEFAAGALLAIAGPRVLTAVRARAMAWAGVGALVAAVALISGTSPVPGFPTLLPVVGTVLLIAAGTSRNSVSEALSAPPIVRVGDWSYSIYLWHWPVIVLSTVLWPGRVWVPILAALLSFAPALASYHWVEQPLRNLQTLGRPKFAALVALTVGVPILVALGVGYAAKSYWSPRAHAAVTGDQSHAGYELGCHDRLDGTQVDPCVWNQSSTGGPVYLIGDSNAAHFVEGLEIATREGGRPLAVSTASGCPNLDLEIERPSSPGFGARCRAHAQAVFAWLESQQPGLVFISHSDAYWREPERGVVLPDGSVARDARSKIAVMEDALRRGVEGLEAAGHRVVLVQTVPHFEDPYAWSLDRCSLFETTSGECEMSMPSAYAVERAAAVRSAISEVARLTGAFDLDLTDVVCQGGVCKTTSQEGVLRYRDATHISVPMSESLAPEFGEAIQAASAE